MSWWLDGLNPQGLSQGDIVDQLLCGAADQPVKYLEKVPLEKGGNKSWPQTTKLQPFKEDDRGFYVARGRLIQAIVVSHSCELDKKNRGHVLVAPIAPIERVTDLTVRENILSQRRRAFLPLPNIPKLGTYYADFRMLTFVERVAITEASRQASMTDEGTLRLRAQLVAFFTRIKPEVLEVAIMEAIKNENQE